MTIKEIENLIKRYNKLIEKRAPDIEKVTLKQLTETARSERDFERIAKNLNEIFKPEAFESVRIGNIEVPKFLREQFNRNLAARNEMIQTNNLQKFNFDPNMLRSKAGLINLNRGFNKQAGEAYSDITNGRYFDNYYKSTYNVEGGEKIRKALDKIAKDGKIEKFVQYATDESNSVIITIFEYYFNEELISDLPGAIERTVEVLSEL